MCASILLIAVMFSSLFCLETVPAVSRGLALLEFHLHSLVKHRDTFMRLGTVHYLLLTADFKASPALAIFLFGKHLPPV